jgi:coenzyme PQQ synthesis protein D (PqqD)
VMPGRRPSRSRSVAWQTIDGETVLLRTRENELLGLNPVGGRIWELADGTRSIDQIVDTVAADFRVPAEITRADALRFLEELTSLCALDWPAE